MFLLLIMVRARVRARAFQKLPFTFHKGAGKAVYKGVCGVSAPFGAFTYPSRILHTDGCQAKTCSKIASSPPHAGSVKAR